LRTLPPSSRLWIRHQPQTFFEKGIRMLSERWKKMCWLRRGVRWRLTCASVWQLWLKKKKPAPAIFEPLCITWHSGLNNNLVWWLFLLLWSAYHADMKIKNNATFSMMSTLSELKS
jgi:hypothetical protein